MKGAVIFNGLGLWAVAGAILFASYHKPTVIIAGDAKASPVSIEVGTPPRLPLQISTDVGGIDVNVKGQ